MDRSANDLAPRDVAMPRSKRRIAYLSLEAPHEGQASYTHVFEIVRGLRELGYDVDLSIPRYSSSGQAPSIFRKLREYAWLQGQLIQKLGSYDLLYIRAHNMALPLALAARRRDVPVIHEVNGPYTDILTTYRWMRLLEAPLRVIQQKQYVWADALVAVTPQLRTWLYHQGCTCPIEVVPNGVDLDLFNPERETMDDLPPKYVVFFGGFARWQGIRTMIEATSSPSWPKETDLVFVGDGQLRREVEEAARTNPRIRYIGRLPYREVASTVVKALAGLVPKTRQTDTENTGLFPVKLCEILACGRPVIVADYPGQADLVRSSECGIVIPPDDPEALAAAVAKIAKSPAAAAEMGRRGYDHVRREHSWKHRAQQTAALIAKTVEAGRSRGKCS